MQFHNLLYIPTLISLIFTSAWLDVSSKVTSLSRSQISAMSFPSVSAVFHVQWNLSILRTPLDIQKCPLYRGVLYSEVEQSTKVLVWDKSECPFSGGFYYWEGPLLEVPLYSRLSCAQAEICNCVTDLTLPTYTQLTSVSELRKVHTSSFPRQLTLQVYLPSFPV